jgi:hypothetical protein
LIFYYPPAPFVFRQHGNVMNSFQLSSAIDQLILKKSQSIIDLKLELDGISQQDQNQPS